MLAVITTVLNLITATLLPLLGTSAATATLIGNVVTTIENLLPVIIQFVPQLYQSVKNIIQALTADPATTADQLAKLQSMDAQLDAAFEAAAQAVDPDAPAPSV